MWPVVRKIPGRTSGNYPSSSCVKQHCNSVSFQLGVLSQWRTPGIADPCGLSLQSTQQTFSRQSSCTRLSTLLKQQSLHPSRTLTLQAPGRHRHPREVSRKNYNTGASEEDNEWPGWKMTGSLRDRELPTSS